MDNNNHLIYDEGNRDVARIIQNPDSLQFLSVSCLIDFLTVPFVTYRRNAFRASDVKFIKKNIPRLRRVFEQLPVSMRQDILNESLANARNQRCDFVVERFYPLSLFLIQVLYDVKIKTVSIPCFRHFSRWQQNTLLKFLSEDGMRLESLKLASMFQCHLYHITLLDSHKMARLLDLAKCLLQLEIHHVASDYILKVVGTTCHHLRELDVSHSINITNTGIAYLILNWNRTEDDQESMKTSKDEQKVSKEMDNAVLDEKGDYLLPPSNPNGEECLKYSLNKTLNQVCFNLTKIYLSGTRITNHGINFLVKYISNLMLLDHNVGHSKQLEISEDDKAKDGVRTEDPPYFNIEYAHKGCNQWTGTTNPCPMGKESTVFTRRRYVCPLSCFSHLTALSIHSTSPSANWIPEVYTYLQVKGETLVEFVLRHPGSFSVAHVVRHCPNLQLLVVSCSEVHWEEEEKDVVSLDTKRISNNILQYVLLGKQVMWSVVTNILTSLPGLTHLGLASCVGVNTDEVLDLITQFNVAKSIEVFYSVDANVFQNVDNVANFLRKQRHIEAIGSLDSLTNQDEESKFMDKLGLEEEGRSLEILHSDYWLTCAALYDFLASTVRH